MNRKQFMKKLEWLLRDLPEEERQEAVKFYNDYFDDAGPENEATVIQELGSPEQVARTIREGMSDDEAGYTERKSEDSNFYPEQNSPTGYQKSESHKDTEQKVSNPWKTFSLILLFLLSAPIVIPLVIAAVATVGGIIIGIIGIVIAIVVVGIVLLFAGIATVIYGGITLLSVPVLGFALGGMGCLILAAGILSCLLMVYCVVKLLPLCIRGLLSAFHFIFGKAGTNK